MVQGGTYIALQLCVGFYLLATVLLSKGFLEKVSPSLTVRAKLSPAIDNTDLNEISPICQCQQTPAHAACRALRSATQFEEQFVNATCIDPPFSAFVSSGSTEGFAATAIQVRVFVCA